jgi:biotin carboxyl carrier protein
LFKNKKIKKMMRTNVIKRCVIGKTRRDVQRSYPITLFNSIVFNGQCFSYASHFRSYSAAAAAASSTNNHVTRESVMPSTGNSTGSSASFFIRVPTFENLPPDSVITVNRIVRKKTGEFVDQDDVVAELMVHSLNDIPIDVTAPEGGFLHRVLVKEGDQVRQGDVLMEMSYKSTGNEKDIPNPVEHVVNVVKDMKMDPKIYKSLQESFARASSTGWAIIGGGVVLGVLLNWAWHKVHKSDEKKSNGKQG